MKPSIQPCLAALAVVLLFSGHALAAESASVEITLTGEAKPVCLLPSGSQTGGSGASFANNRVTFDTLVDDSTALVKATSAQVTFPQVMCNYNGYVSVGTQNGGLTTDGQVQDVSGNFLNKVPYKITGTWGNVAMPPLNTATMPAGAGSVSKQAGGANRGDLILTVVTEDGTTPVLQGRYSDIIVVKVGATY